MSVTHTKNTLRGQNNGQDTQDFLWRDCIRIFPLIQGFPLCLQSMTVTLTLNADSSGTAVGATDTDSPEVDMMR